MELEQLNAPLPSLGSSKIKKNIPHLVQTTNTILIKMYENSSTVELLKTAYLGQLSTNSV